MFREASEALVHGLSEALACRVSLLSAGSPLPEDAREGVGPTRRVEGEIEIVLFWLGVSSLTSRPASYSTQISGNLEYLAYPAGGTALERHTWLEKLILAAADCRVQCSATRPSCEWWAALGLAPRPSVTLVYDFVVQTATRATNPPASIIVAEPKIAASVSGRVVAASGEPCAGVTIRTHRAASFAVSDGDGRFSILRSVGQALPELSLEHPHATGLHVEWDEQHERERSTADARTRSQPREERGQT